MSSAFRGQAESAARPVTGRYPVAEVSRSALAHNVTLAVASGIVRFAPRLLRADAWGHGAATVETVLAASSLTPEQTGDPIVSLRPETLFGLPGAPEGAIPVMRLVGVVLATKGLREGEGVSYGYLHRAAADTRIALITGGYGQGLVRSLGNAAEVTIAGRRYPIIGRVAMDVCVVEIADAAVGRGDEVVFFGDLHRNEPSVGEWASATGLSSAELVTAVGLQAGRRVSS